MSAKDDYEVRKQRALRRLQTDSPICVGCGYSDWRGLELHHIAGQKHHGDLAIVCRNCHRALSDSQCDHPSLQEPDSIVGRYLVGLGDLLAMIAERLREFGSKLISIGEGNPPTAGGEP